MHFPVPGTTPRRGQTQSRISIMTTVSSIRALCFVFALGALSTKALAGARDYEFQPIAVDVKNGAGSELAVRLIHKPSGKPVTEAVIFRTRLDMSPESMGEMTAKHTAMPAGEPGVYRFKADLTMAGSWALKLQAKVPGESETIEATIVFKAK
jgi:hypothetical protein